MFRNSGVIMLVSAIAGASTFMLVVGILKSMQFKDMVGFAGAVAGFAVFGLSQFFLHLRAGLPPMGNDMGDDEDSSFQDSAAAAGDLTGAATGVRTLGRD